MNKANQIKQVAHVSMSLKSFDMNVEIYSNPTLLGDLQAIYKNRRYYFHVVTNLTVKDIKDSKFVQTVEWCDKNNASFVVITKSWDKQLNPFALTDDYLWKIIPLEKLTKIGSDYLDRRQKERDLKKAIA